MTGDTIAAEPPGADAGMPAGRRARLIWTLSHALLLLGGIITLYVGGLTAHDAYHRYAARGDTDVPAPRLVAASGAGGPLSFVAPMLNAPPRDALRADGTINTEAPPPSTINRIIIPSIDVDAKVVDVGWDIVNQDGDAVTVWQVAEYAVGHHLGSANPGEGDNIVLTGHVGGYGKIFRDLIQIQPDDDVILVSGGQQYRYIVREQVLIHEAGVSQRQRLANARFIQPTGEEMLTLVTCWPESGDDRYAYRLVVRAVPFAAAPLPAATTPGTLPAVVAPSVLR